MKIDTRPERLSRSYRRLARLALVAVVIVVSVAGSARAQMSAEEAEALRKAQDPLADVKALMTDNTLERLAGQSVYNFQLQPVYAIKTSLGFNVIARGIVPIAGAPTDSGTTWGVSDAMGQFFFVPKTNGSIKFGVGPQVSLRTRTNDAVAGPGWGGGFGGVVFGFAGPVSYGGIVGQHWGRDNFNRTSVQPIVFYNMGLFGGSYVGYASSIVYDWKVSGTTGWSVPVGLTFGKTFLLNHGYMVDVNFGAYQLVVAPITPNRQFKLGFSVFFP